MATNVEIPPLGESITEAVLAKWLKPEGARVKRDEPICELETDKANVELPSPGDGVLRRLKKEGDTVKVGAAVATLEEGEGRAEAPPQPKAERAPSPGNGKEKDKAGEELLSPAVRNLVEENKLDPGELKGTGPGGRILKEDVLKYLGAQKAPKAEPEKVKAEAKTEPEKPKSPAAKPSPPSTGPITALTVDKQRSLSLPGGEERREPMSKIRKKIAERLVSVQHQAAMLTTFNEVDMSAVQDLRAKYKERFQETYGVSLGLMSFFARASVLALKEFPVVNAFIDGDDIVFHDAVNLGIAVSTERGLIVPVLRHAEAMSFGRIESEIKRMITAARDGKLGLQELSGGTFTITNGGVFGSLMSTPILNSPQSAILGMHAIQKRPMAMEDKVVVRPMMYLALSYDHRLIDGRDSVSFLVRLKQMLEDPARLLLEV